MCRAIKDPNRISINEAAKCVGMSAYNFKQCMIQDSFPISVGTVFKKEGGKNYTFYVYRGAVEKLQMIWGLTD